MQKKVYGKSLQRSKLAMLTCVLLTTMLAGCQTPQRATRAPTSLVPTDTKPLACVQFAPMSYSVGKPGVTKEEVIAALQREDNPLGWARGLLGDTMTTRKQVSAYGAVRKALQCE